MHNPGSHGQQLRTSANRSTPGRVQLRSMRDGLEFPRVINADRASSCDPYGRGLDAQPWIPVPEVCTTPDSRPAVCRRLQTFGERLQTKASSCDPLRAGTRCSPPDGSMGQQLRTSANRSAPSRLAVAIHGDLVVVRSSDQLRAGPAAAIPKGGDSMHNHGSQGQHGAQPWIPGPEVCTTPDSRPAVCRRLHTFGERLQTKVSSCDSCGPVLDAVPLMDPWASSCERRQIDQRRAGWQLRSMGTWLEFDQVINSGPGQQLRSPREGTRCTTLDPMAGSMHNPGSMASMVHNLGSQSQQLRTSANRSAPGRLAAAIHGNLVGISSSNRLRTGLQLRSMRDGLYFHRLTNSGPN
jgi:hypothetical protein